MRLMRGAAAVTIARRIYTEARKPENQARIRAAVEQVKQRQAARSGSSSKGSGGKAKSHRAR